MRQCSARDLIRSSISLRCDSVPSARRVANSRPCSSSSPSANSDQNVRANSSARVSATSAAKSICKAHSRALRREPINLKNELRVLNFVLRDHFQVQSTKHKVPCDGHSERNDLLWRLTISIAAIAASYPLLLESAPARSLACSTLSAVITP